MKRTVIHRFFAGVLLFVLTMTIVPFAAFHHHEEKEICDVASDIPEKYKHEKDNAKHHYHSYERDCYICLHFKIHQACIVHAPVSYQTATAFEYSNTYLQKVFLTNFQYKASRAPPQIS